MKEFSRCPSCGCSVDEMLRGHHSAADCSILKYGEREAAEARAEALKKAAERAVAWFVTPFSYGNEEAELRAAILADEPKEREVEGPSLDWLETKLSTYRAWTSQSSYELDRKRAELAQEVYARIGAEVERKLKEASR